MTSSKPSEQDPAPRPRRRRFTPEYKLRIVAEYDAAPAGEKGAILRRERLYSSHVIEWRQARDAGALARLTDHRTSPARPRKHPAEAENARLRRENERLRAEVDQKNAALEVLGKTHALLRSLSKSAD
ncbi:transposase [Streptomyces litchfieldiae]|uniref:Transposase n=1 Tax=Streptomyces litchfieldiae TaxID=3075543 RepID=A0ABU2MMW7_9ACTN|nr:transposase [Streptomyces sp. DSM 44938]MDT0342703.1 transposase [Streptomyces sp. DSM 44938]